MNKAPYDEGWFVKILIEDPDEVESLMTPRNTKNTPSAHCRREATR